MPINYNKFINDEIYKDLIEYFPLITNKKIYYQLLTQHVQYNRAQHQTFQDDTFDLNESSLKWTVPLTVQKRLEMIDHDWNIGPLMLHKVPNLYLLQDSLFLDNSSLYSKIILTTWNWQEKSKCFPLIKAAKNHDSFSHRCYNRQETPKIAQYSQNIIRKLAIFDTQKQIKEKLSRPVVDYGKEYYNNAQITTTVNDGSNNEPTNAITFHTTYNFLPSREIEVFMKQNQQQKQITTVMKRY